MLAPASPKHLHRTFGSASLHFDGQLLEVSTGAVTRTWRWTGKGLVTTGLKDTGTGREWTAPDSTLQCDWSNADLIPPAMEAELLAVTGSESDDEGFTSPHLEVVAEMLYPAADLIARYVIWAYPGANGLRTQLWWKRSKKSGSRDTDAVTPVITPVWAETENGPANLIYSHYELRFRLEELRPAHRFICVVSWSSPDGQERRQSIDLCNTDGETTISVLPETPLTAEHAAFSFEIPAAIRADGACIVSIRRNAEAKEACIQELWLYQDGPAESAPPMTGETLRLTTLANAAPAGFHLAAYLSASILKEHRTEKRQDAEERRVDYIPLDSGEKQSCAIGYYNDTQNRNKPDTPVLREESAKAGVTDWANIFCVEDHGAGLAMVKESHKCVNQPGVDTGAFEWTEQGLRNTGWGLSGKELSFDRFRWCWASWVILYDESGSDSRPQAIKKFDRLRFPPRAERDLWTVVCTWGHGRNAREGRDAATEKEVLREMEIAAELGIDMLLIDDGWQVSPHAVSWQPEPGIGWRPHPLAYPDGWKRVLAAKKNLKLRLGLWAVAQHADAEDLLWNWRQLGTEQVKLDFANLRNHRQLDELTTTVRKFIRGTGHRCIISWDTTENQARYGYYWAREYGNVHFMNRKPEMPERVIYIPWLALRDFWQLAHYQNLNKWQLTIQNPEVVNQEKSDAYLHSASYCVATALMGIPEFMAIPRYYSDGAKREVHQLLAIYKEHRQAIFASYVYPIGEQPTNGSWSGFQSWDGESQSGYVTLFRERLNRENIKQVALRYIRPGTRVNIRNLRTGGRWSDELGPNGLKLEINKPADFLFLHYQLAP